MKSEKPFKVNGYVIKYNDYWGFYMVSHEDIGSNIAQFKLRKDAEEYARNG